MSMLTRVLVRIHNHSTMGLAAGTGMAKVGPHCIVLLATGMHSQNDFFDIGIIENLWIV